MEIHNVDGNKDKSAILKIKRYSVDIIKNKKYNVKHDKAIAICNVSYEGMAMSYIKRYNIRL